MKQCSSRFSLVDFGIMENGTSWFDEGDVNIYREVLQLRFSTPTCIHSFRSWKKSWTKPSSLLTIFDPRKCLHLPHIVHMTYFWPTVNLGQNSNPKSLFFTFTPCKLMRASKSFQSSSSLLQFSTNELSQTNNRSVISVEWWRHERYLWRHICCWWRHIPPLIVLGAYSVSTQNQKQRLLRSGIFNFCV